MILKHWDQLLMDFESSACGIKCKHRRQLQFVEVESVAMKWFLMHVP